MGKSRPWGLWVLIWLGLTAVALTNIRERAIPDAVHPDEHRSDLTVYTEAGGLMLRGVDPYRLAGPANRKRYLYPPILALLVSPLDSLDRPWAVVVWFYLSALLGFGLLREALLLTRATLDPVPRYLPVVALLGVACPLGLGVQLGQVATLLGYLLLLGTRLALLGRASGTTALGGLVLALPVAIKLLPLVPVGCVVGALTLHSVRRAACCGAGLAAGLVLFTWLLPAALLGWGWNQQLLASWRQEVLSDPNLGQHAPLYCRDNVSLSAAVVGLGRWAGGNFDTFQKATDDPAGPFAPLGVAVVEAPGPRLARAAVALLLLVGAWGYARLRSPLGVLATLGVGVGAMSLITPLAWSHYYTLFLPALLFVPALALQAGLPGAARWLAAWPAGLLLADDLLSPYARWLHLLPLGMALWYLAACWLPWRLRPGRTAVHVGAHETLC